MKYNPRASNKLAMLPGFLDRHPLEPEGHAQGFLECLFDLQEMLKAVTGMSGVSLTPMAGAQGEFAGVAMIRAYHVARGDTGRTQIIVPDAAHGTNPATATMCGCDVVEIPTGPDGDVDVDALRKVVGPQTAGIMLTNPVHARRVRAAHRRDRRRGARRGRAAVLRRRQPERHPRPGPARGHGLRRGAHQPAQDLFHAPRRRRSRCGHRGGDGPPRALPADPDRGQARRASILLAGRERTAPEHRAAVRLHGQRRHPAARLRLHAPAGRRGHAPGVGLRHAECQLPDEAAGGRRLHARLSRSGAPATSSSSR